MKLQHLSIPRLVAALCCVTLAPTLGGCKPSLADNHNVQREGKAHIPASNAQTASTDWVTDEANILPLPTERRIAERVRALEQQTQHQLVVVTVPTLGGQRVEDVARDYGNRLSVGREDHDDGAVILVAPTERRARISLGYGLECFVTDDRAAEIMDIIMTPAFAKGEYGEGVERGTDALIEDMMQIPTDTRAASLAVQNGQPCPA